MRGAMTDKFLMAAERRREKEYKDNKTDCENYSASNDRYGVACIYPWCDYCSFYCPRRVPDGD